MKVSLRILLCLALLAGLVTCNVAQDKAVSRITITVPEAGHAETVVKVNGKELKEPQDKGRTRVYMANVEKGKEYKYKVEALIEPNNYTKITRYKEITVAGGEEAKVDLTVKNPKTDKIVVRWVPTPDDIVDEMCKLGKVTKNDIVYDLGCGDAVMLIRPIEKFHAKRGVGIDLDPKMIKKAKEKVKAAGLADKIELRVGDMLNVKDMSDATVVLLYIGDDLGERVGPVLRRTLKPGARIVSHRFKLGNWEPTKDIMVKGQDGDEYHLLLWVVGEEKK
jgi:uncharacterized protein (TIGR03000 family)